MTDLREKNINPDFSRDDKVDLMATKVICGGVYYNTLLHEVNVQYIDPTKQVVGYDLYINGTRTSVEDSTMDALVTLLAEGHYKLDHMEKW